MVLLLQTENYTSYQFPDSQLFSLRMYNSSTQLKEVKAICSKQEFWQAELLVCKYSKWIKKSVTILLPDLTQYAHWEGILTNHYNICLCDIQIKHMHVSKPGRAPRLCLLWLLSLPFPTAYTVVLVISWNLLHVSAGGSRFPVYYNHRASQLLIKAFYMG